MIENLETTPFDVGIARVFESLLSDVHTCLVGQVTAFDATEQTVSVQPVLKRKFEGLDDPVSLPVIEDVPVVYLGSGDLWITVPVEVDSYVLLVVCERSIANWLDRGGIVDPERSRKFDLSDAIAIPGINPSPDKLTNGVTTSAIELRTRDGKTFIRVKDAEITLQQDQSKSIISMNSTRVLINNNLEIKV
jgi:hypothetical protein